MNRSQTFSAVLVLSCLGFLAAPGAAEAQETKFVRGDFNSDGHVSLSDVLMLKRHLFQGDQSPTCLDSGDVDDNGVVHFLDEIAITRQLFRIGTSSPWGTVVIPEPFPEPGVDPTADIPEDSDVPQDLGCVSYAPQPAEATQDVIRIGSVEALPGETVEVPVFLTNSVAIEAVQLVIEYDPNQFTPDRDVSFVGTYFENATNTAWFKLCDSHPEDRIFTIGLVPNMLDDGPSIAPGMETVIVKIKGKVADDVPQGAMIELIPTNGPNDEGVKPPLYMRNELTHQGHARFASILPETIAGVIGIVDDITFFVRGDANTDGSIDISDPISVLGFLFLGTDPLICRDAADAEDSGVLEITDAIYLLDYLFSFSSAPPAPFPDASGDPTPDSLMCRS